MGVPSNCWIEAARLWRKIGGELVFVRTKREYDWPCKCPHAFVRLDNGTELEFVPERETLGRWPMPLFRGYWRQR